MSSENQGCLSWLLSLVGLKLSTDKPSSTIEDLPYKSVPLLSEAELLFYSYLRLATPAEYRIMTKVQLKDLVTVYGVDKSEWTRYFNKIKSKHVDFVIWDHSKNTIVKIVELDDKSHDSKKRKDRDEFVDKVLDKAGYTMLRVKCKSSYNLDSLKQSVLS